MGEKENVIKERLAHSSITTTYNVYDHLYPNKQREAADRMEEFM